MLMLIFGVEDDEDGNEDEKKKKIKATWRITFIFVWVFQKI